MRGTAYLDQNVISCLDDDIMAGCLSNFAGLGLKFVVSDVHLTEICKSDSPELFITRLEKIQPYNLKLGLRADQFERQSRELELVNVPFLIDTHRREVGEIERVYLRALTPLLKIFGGASRVDTDDLVELYVSSMRSTVDSLSARFPLALRWVYRPYLFFKLRQAERAIRANFEEIAFASEAEKFNEIRRRIALKGNISQLASHEVVTAIDAVLREVFNENLLNDFPPESARTDNDFSGRISSFSFLLFALGVLPRTGRVFRGDDRRQMREFEAQFLDCLHIENAAHCHFFLTFDKNAARLAAIAYKYSGVKTEVILLKTALPT